MAIFYPDTFVKRLHAESEDKVFDVIKNTFSDSWTVFLSYDYVNRLDNGIVQDGEVDFILYHPDYGILVLEVKGGGISYRNGLWFSGNHLIAPYEQARKNKYAIRALFSKNNTGFPLISISHAVCFSDVTKIKTLPPEAEGVTLTASDFNNFEQACIKIMTSRPVFSNEGAHLIKSDEVMATLLPEFDLAYSPREEIDRDKKIFIKLSELQYQAFGMLKNFNRLNVRGCAGSGKTIIAIKLAEELAREGKRVLMLCYNKILAKRLYKAVKGYYNIRTEAFFDFCMDIAKVPPEDIKKFSSNPKTWTYALPKLAQNAIEKIGISYDAVIVDEGQDFSKEAWNVIQMLVCVDGSFHIFYDDDQNIYNSTLNIPQTQYPEIILNVNYRNTQKIFSSLKKFITIQNAKHNESAPLGLDPELYTIEDEQQRRDFIKSRLTQLVKDNQVLPSDIVILGGHSLKNTCIKERNFGDFLIEEDETSTTPNAIKYRTYMKFKGCESPVVFVIDVDKEDSRWSKNSALYTAMSRAQSLLIVVNKK